MSSRPGTANPPSIEEGDEDVSQSDSNPEMTETQNQLTVDNLPQETKMSEVETVSDLDPHTEVRELCDLYPHVDLTRLNASFAVLALQIKSVKHEQC